MSATVFDLDTNRQVGTGSYAHLTLPAKSFKQVLLPLNFTYLTSNSSDQTCEYFCAYHTVLDSLIPHHQSHKLV